MADQNPAQSKRQSKEPPRGEFPPEVVKAIRTVHRPMFGHSYKPGEGVMHHAGGPYWRNHMLKQADDWERWAKAARICAEELPGEEGS